MDNVLVKLAIAQKEITMSKTSETVLVVTPTYAYLKRYINNHIIKVAIPLDTTVVELEPYFSYNDETFLQYRERK